MGRDDKQEEYGRVRFSNGRIVRNLTIYAAQGTGFGQEVTKNSLEIWRLNWFSPDHRMNIATGIDLAIYPCDRRLATERSEIGRQKLFEDRFEIRVPRRTLSNLGPGRGAP